VAAIKIYPENRITNVIFKLVVRRFNLSLVEVFLASFVLFVIKQYFIFVISQNYVANQIKEKPEKSLIF